LERVAEVKYKASLPSKGGFLEYAVLKFIKTREVKLPLLWRGLG